VACSEDLERQKPMPDFSKRSLRIRDILVLVGVAIAFLVIIAILWQGFFATD
jgi:hypothetical protein